jgi:helicase
VRKRRTACLYYISGMGMEEIERAMSQFGGAFDGSAGPIRSVTSRTCDVLTMIGRIAELLHPTLVLEQRIAKLVLRLDLGIQGAVVDLARYAERSLDRADYRRLCDAKMTDRDTLAAADDNDLLPLIGNERRKLAVLRDAVERWRRARPAVAAAALPPYQA